MDPEKRTQAFLKQARKGSKSWRMQSLGALALVGGLLCAAGASLWIAWNAHSLQSTGIYPVLVWLALAAAAGMWAVHAELMEGAATLLERQSDALGRAPPSPEPPQDLPG